MRVAGPDGDLDLGAVAHRDGDVVEHGVVLRTGLLGGRPEHRPPVQVQHRVPTGADLGATAVLEHRELAPSSGLDADPSSGHPEDGDVAHEVPGHVGGGDREVRCDRSAVEHQARVLRRVELTEHDGSQQAVGGPDVGGVHAEAGERLPDELPEAVGADLRQHGSTTPQPGSTDRHVGGGPTEVLGERRDVLERPVLLGVDVDADPADREQVEVGAHGRSSVP